MDTGPYFRVWKKLIQFNGEGGLRGRGTKHRRLLQVNQNKKQFNRSSCSFFCVSSCFLLQLHLWQLLLFRGSSSSGTCRPCQSYWVANRRQHIRVSSFRTKDVGIEKAKQSQKQRVVPLRTFSTLNSATFTAQDCGLLTLIQEMLTLKKGKKTEK